MRRLAFLCLTALPAVAAAQEVIPPATDAPPPPAPKKKGLPISTTYDGGVTFRSDDGTFELRLNGLLQARFEWVNVQDSGGPNTRFILTRARLAMSGFIWKNTQFKVEEAFSDAGNTRLRDFFLNQVFLDGALQLRVGQFKRPFNRQEITSDFATAFLEKSVTNTFAGVQGGRDIGIMLSNGYEKSPDGLEWAFGVFNGQGDGSVTSIACTTDAMTMAVTCAAGTPTSTPGDWQPQVVARAGWNMGGIKGYSEADLEGGPFRLAVAANYRLKNIQNKTPATAMEHDIGADFIAKIEGFDITGAFFFRKIEDVSDTQIAFHVQAGYMLLPKQAGLQLRFARVPDSAAPVADGTNTNEVRGCFTWYFSGSHSLKWLTEVGYLKSSADAAKSTLQLRTGAQLIF